MLLRHNLMNPLAKDLTFCDGDMHRKTSESLEKSLEFALKSLEEFQGGLAIIHSQLIRQQQQSRTAEKHSQ